MTTKQHAFAIEYLKDGNATQAAVRAGYAARSAHAIAHKLLKLDDVAAIVNGEKQRVLKAHRRSVDATLEEIDHIAHSDIRAILNEDGTMKPPAEWPEDIARAVASIEVFEEFAGKGDDRQLIGHTKKVKLWSKPDGLRMKGQTQKLFTEVHEHKITGDLGDRLAKARARARGGK